VAEPVGADPARLLARLSLFRRLRGPELETLVRITEAVTFGPGEPICQQGEPGICMFVMVDGTAKVSVTKDGKAVEVASLGPGQVIGEMSLIDAQPRSATVTAKTDVVAFKIERAALIRMRARKDPAGFKLQLALAEQLCERIRAVNTHVTELLAGPPVERAPRARPMTAPPERDARRSFWKGMFEKLKGDG